MTWSIGDKVPAALLDATVLDRLGGEVRLGDHLDDRLVILAFLRHYGCTGCSQQVDGLVPHAARLAEMGLSIVLLGNGDPAYLRGFISRQRLEGYPLTLLTDPSLSVYRAAGLGKSLWRVFGPQALAREVVVRTMGYSSTDKEGDILQQGGVALLDRAGALRFFAEARVAAEPVAPARIIDAAMELVAEDLADQAAAVV